ncbi:hypothetical protein WA158_006877 [Blastocystis sp. Blastoise]
MSDITIQPAVNTTTTTEKSSTGNESIEQILNIPDDTEPMEAQMIMKLLETMDITSYDPNILPMLIEYMRSYMRTVLNDSKRIAYGAGKTDIDCNDLSLALTFYDRKSMCLPLSKDEYESLSTTTNSIPLPSIQAEGVQLPNSKYVLSGLKSQYKV